MAQATGAQAKRPALPLRSSCSTWADGRLPLGEFDDDNDNDGDEPPVQKPVMNARSQRGFTFVELFVGLALGLLVVAAGVLLLAQQLREQRALPVEARSDAGPVHRCRRRDLRRAGYWAMPAPAWSPRRARRANPWRRAGADAAVSDAASYAYSRDAAENQVLDTNEQFGLRLRNGAVELQLGVGNWR